MADKKDKAYVTRAQLDAIAAELGKLKNKEEERFRLKAGITQISSVITETLEKGFSYPDIAAILDRNHGIEIKPDTLRAYHRGALKSQSSDAKPNGSKPAAKSVGNSPSQTGRSASATLPLTTPEHGDGKFIQDPEV